MSKQHYDGDLFKGIAFSGDASTGFLPLSGNQVEEYLKGVDYGLDSKIGCIHYDEEHERYLAFADIYTKNEYLEDTSRTDLILGIFAAGGGGGSTDVYSMMLTVDSSVDITVTSTSTSLPVKAESTIKYGSTGEIEYISEEVTLQIQTRTSSSSPWISRGEAKVQSNLSVFTDIDISQYITAGQNYVRIRGVGEYSTSIWKSFSIYVAALYLKDNTPFEIPMSGDNLTVNYLIGGAVSKLLQFEIGTGFGQGFVRQYSYLNGDSGCSRNIGTATNLSTGMTFTFYNEGIMNPGAHTIRARLFASESVKTDWIECQYMVKSTSVDVIAINNINTQLDNYSDVTFFDYSVAAREGNTVGLVFKLKDSATGNTLAEWTSVAFENTQYSFTTQLGLDVDRSIETIYAYMYTYDDNGNELTQPVFYTISNSADFAPTEGYDFVISPSQRSNSETHPDRIINQADGSVVDSSWNGFGFSTDGWMEVLSDINNINSPKIRALSVPAGRTLRISYNWLSDFMSENNTGKNVTFEIDFRTNQILDETEPIVQMCSVYPNDGKAWGFEMLPLEAYVMTNRKRIVDDQNVTWAEGVRQHMAVNVVYGIRGMNLVRIFIDGKMEREFKYDTNDIFIGENMDMIIGNQHSDIDIFKITVYRKSLSTSEIMQDRKASFSTVNEKLDFEDANDILGDDECISFTKASQKYNCLGLTGHLATYGDENKGKTKNNSLTIHKPMDLDRSGVLTGLENSGQGTTAMTYFDWNQQQKIGSGSRFYPESDPTTYEEVSGYSLADGEYAAKKLCGKMNFASSMQGHKMGLCKIYTEVFKQMVNTGTMSKPGQFIEYPNARLAVYEEPFLFFHRETENDDWTFKYLMTWGPGKGDKPTFGYKDSKTPHMLMLEGALNDAPLALFHIPWNDDIVYDPGNEAYMYNNAKQINFGFGHVAVDSSSNEYPDDAQALTSFRNFFNFVYLHNNRIKYFSGTYTQLKAADSSVAPISNFYWVTANDPETGSEKYDLFRYDNVVKQWVNCGIEGGGGTYTRLNLQQQYVSFCSDLGETPVTFVDGQWESTNSIIINTRVAHFSALAETYMHVDDCLYHSCFVKLFAGTDNRAKNTYYYTDPVTLKIRHMQDDLDTTVKTNNVGQNRKPYYVEEHDKDSLGDFYWQGEDCTFYNLLEAAFPTRMETTMANMLTAMATLGGSAFDYIVSRLLEAQNYFPAIAYNEIARLVYENAQVAMDEGRYKNGTSPMSQSCGTQKWSEYDWVKNRLMYISSWCEYGEFAGNTSAPNGLSWRGRPGSYQFNLTPAKWLYPRIGADNTNFDASTNAHKVRIRAGETIHYPEIPWTGDGTIYIRGIDYYLDIGDMNVGNSSTDFKFQGKLLQSININPNATDPNLFGSMSVSIGNATNIKSIKIRNVDTITQPIDLSNCTRLETIDMRGSTFNIITLPKSEILSTVYFPYKLDSIRIDGQPNLRTVTIDGVDYLMNIYIDQKYAGSFNSAALAKNIWESKVSSGGTISSAKFLNIEWTSIQADMLLYYNASPVSSITGRIQMLPVSSDRYLLLSEIQSLIDKCGNIQSESNSLYIDYPKRDITSFTISGIKYIKTTGEFNEWKIKVSPQTGNNILIDSSTGKESVLWEFIGDNAETALTYAEFTDPIRGILNVKQLQTNEENFTIRVTINKYNGSVVTKEKHVGFYNRIPRVGDFAYYDGTFDDEYDNSKTLVGAVTRKRQIDASTYKLIVYAKENAVIRSTNGSINTSSAAWGLYLDSGNTNGFDSAMMSSVAQTAGVSSAYDIPGLSNITSTGIYNSSTGSSDYRYINDYYLDPNNDDGYATIASGGACNVYTEGMNLSFDSVHNTDTIVNHANAIILNYLMETYPNNEDIKIPTTRAELGDAMLALRNENESATSPTRYYQFFFPAAYGCRLYEPAVNTDNDEVLDDQYKSGHWNLPALGDLCRIYNFYHNSRGRDTSNTSVSVNYADENPESEALLPLFANLLLRIRRVTQAASPFTMPSNSSNYWSSLEYNAYFAWYVNFSSGNVTYGTKYGTTAVARAVAEYTFVL